MLTPIFQCSNTVPLATGSKNKESDALHSCGQSATVKTRSKSYSPILHFFALNVQSQGRFTKHRNRPNKHYSGKKDTAPPRTKHHAQRIEFHPNPLTEENKSSLCFFTIKSSLFRAYLSDAQSYPYQRTLTPRLREVTNRERIQRNLLRIHCMDTVPGTHHLLRTRANSLDIQSANSCVIIEGQLPSQIHQDALVPAIRQAGALAEVVNRVYVHPLST